MQMVRGLLIGASMLPAHKRPWLLLLAALGVSGCPDPCLDDGLFQDSPSDCAAVEETDDASATATEGSTGEPDPCFNGVRDDDEADVDCGGLCAAKCGVGQGCGGAEDCETAICDDEVCVPAASCDDGIKDDGESDEDCGGVCGATCPIDAECEDFTDCETFVCDPEVGLCAGPSCEDGAPNGSETDVDCGGPDCEPCADAGTCNDDSDCLSETCDLEAGLCVSPTCVNGEQDEGESDVDCGGAGCAPCSVGEACTDAEDCASQLCEGGVCGAASCDDGIRNQGESDVDCGGPNCGACEVGQDCEVSADCATELCDPVHGVCEAESCSNGVIDDGETDIDCGGQSCAPCEEGEGCDQPSDCASESCATGTCAPATCTDGILNGNESDIDCGGDACDSCDDGGDCLLSSDCASSVCLSEVCQPPTCDDGVQNGDESDTDCGGTCGSTCPEGESCNIGDDCITGVCGDDGACEASACDDGVRNGDETDVDCGGETCGPCEAPGMCEDADDCISQVCTKGMCTPAACDDGIINGDETDVDCGGQTCAPCEDGESCGEAEDCSSLVCTGGACVVPACSDGVQNQDETDVDCGGGTCGPCDDGQGCAADGDCVSSVCDETSSTCEAATCSDGVLNGTETDLDCGGAACSGCDAGESCDGDDDCLSLVCSDGGLCEAPTCDDGVTNGDETDVDCGGDTCDPCVDGQSCVDAGDCESMVCLGLACQPSACDDGVVNGDETDVDCGGSCQPCDDGESCVTSGDCESLVCDGGSDTCAAPTCGDGVQNQGESDTDCGGPCGATCNDGESCDDGGDCVSLVCDGGTNTCSAPTCSDGLQNQGETDADCGGPCGATCSDGESCDDGGDCISLVCDGVANTCSAPSCSDGVQNQGETDADCGGPCGATCDPGEGCSGNADCVSLVCDGGSNTCAAPSCSDGVLNGTESDADCGGSCGSTCETGEGCGLGADCVSLVCDPIFETCSAPTCADGVQNGDETDADCGGACGATCDDGEGCSSAGDCLSGVCDGVSDTCVAPSCSDGVQNGDETGLDCGGSCGGTCDTGDACIDGDDCLSAGCTAGACNPPLSVIITPNACGDAAGGPVSYTAVASGGTGGPYTYQWSPDDGTVSPADAASTTITPTDYASYTVTADDGVSTADAVGVVVLSNQPFNLQNNCTLYTGLGFQGTPATIVYSAGGTVATEQGNNDIGLHLCEDVAFTNVRLVGSAEVDTAGDDDWFGYVWGAQDASNFYILSWKQSPQNFFGCPSGNSPGGIIVKRVFAPSFGDLTGADLYCANDTAQSELLLGPDEAYNQGWADFVPYTIEIEHRPTGSDITVTNDNTSTEIASFAISDTTYPAGFFGSHTLSQSDVSVGPLFGECL